MKLAELLNEVDWGDHSFSTTSLRQTLDREATANQHVRGFWIYTAKQPFRALAGPFKTEEAAEQFKANRPDRIPRDAIVRPFKGQSM